MQLYLEHFLLLRHNFFFITIIKYTKTYEKILAHLFEPQGCPSMLLQIQIYLYIPLTQIITNVICFNNNCNYKAGPFWIFFIIIIAPNHYFEEELGRGIGLKFVIGSIWWLWVLFETYLIIQLRFLSAIKRFSIVHGSFTK